MLRRDLKGAQRGILRKPSVAQRTFQDLKQNKAPRGNNMFLHYKNLTKGFNMELFHQMCHVFNIEGGNKAQHVTKHSVLVLYTMLWITEKCSPQCLVPFKAGSVNTMQSVMRS